jgi:uncharacterized membrane protein YraQ (UPF0718 family)
VDDSQIVYQFIKSFVSILFEAMPFVVLGAIIAGILEEVIPQQAIGRLFNFIELYFPRPLVRFVAILIGGLLGLVFPMCECGIVPIMRRLLRKGFPLSTCVAYILAGPIVNPIVIAATFVAFTGQEEHVTSSGQPAYQMSSWWMTGMRVGLGYLVATVTALVVEWQTRRHGMSKLLLPVAMPPVGSKGDDAESLQKKTFVDRLGNISQAALSDFVDITVYLIIGALLSATVHVIFSRDDIETLGRGYAPIVIVLMMVLAVFICLCSEADAFVAASFVSLRPSAKVAFLVLGPMLDFKLIFMYMQVFRKRLILTIIPCVVVQVFVYSLVVHYTWEYFAPRYYENQPLPVSPQAKVP